MSSDNEDAKDYSKMALEELEAELIRLGAQRAEIRVKQLSVQRAITDLSINAALFRKLASMTDAEREALKQAAAPEA